MGKAKRKMRPQPPWWWELENDIIEKFSKKWGICE